MEIKEKNYHCTLFPKIQMLTKQGQIMQYLLSEPHSVFLFCRIINFLFFSLSYCLSMYSFFFEGGNKIQHITIIRIKIQSIGDTMGRHLSHYLTLFHQHEE